MEEITFEMATELGLIPETTQRLYGSFPFESAYAREKRELVQEASYRAEKERLREDYQFVTFDGKTLKVI